MMALPMAVVLSVMPMLSKILVSSRYTRKWWSVVGSKLWIAVYRGCEYIAFVDSDDSIEPDIYEAAISYLEAHADVDIVGYGINEIRLMESSIAGRRRDVFSLEKRPLRSLSKDFPLK